MEKIKSFLDSLAAVSRTHYQIWDSKGRKLFSTDNEKTDLLTASHHLKIAKKVIMSDNFVYAPAEHDGFICGMPMDMDPKTRGAILAMGPRPAASKDNGHPGRMNAFLEQIMMLGQSGNQNGGKPSQNLPESPDPGFEDLFLFANISKQFRSLRFKQPVLGKLMDRIFDTMEVDAAFLQLAEQPQYDLLKIRPDLLKKSDEPDKFKNRLQQLITSGVKKCSGHYCVINNSREDDDFRVLSQRPYRFLAVGVRHIKSTYGWLGLVSYNMDSEFNSKELNILQTLANQLGAMMANMEQYDDLEKFTVNIVCSLVNAVEAKDVYSNGHSKRVHQYTMQITKALDLPKKELNALKWAAVLHDIGKIGIPERILSKPDPLTAKEFDLIKQHPVKGKTILAPIKQLAPSLEAIAHHHERYDGTGYPDGLEGEEIPLGARIIAVADTFDAITSKRSYHASKTPPNALLVLEKVAGAQLDPYLVKVFKKVFNNI